MTSIKKNLTLTEKDLKSAKEEVTSPHEVAPDIYSADFKQEERKGRIVKDGFMVTTESTVSEETTNLTAGKIGQSEER